MLLGRWLQRRGYAFWSLGPCLSWRQLLISHLKNDEIRRAENGPVKVKAPKRVST